MNLLTPGILHIIVEQGDPHKTITLSLMEGHLNNTRRYSDKIMMHVFAYKKEYI